MQQSRYLAIMMSILGAAFAGALDLDQAIAASESTKDAQAMRVQSDSSRALYASAAYPGDISLNLVPGYRRVSDEAFGVPKSESLALSLTLSLPLGLSDDQRDRAESANAQAVFLENSIEWSLALVRLKAYGLYATAWRAQEEENLHSREVAVAEDEFAAMRALFNSGAMSYAEYRKAEQSLRDSYDAAFYGAMSKRITRMELFSWLGLEDDQKPLTMKKPPRGDLPKGQELATNALLNDPEIKDGLARESLSLQQLERAMGFSLPSTLKLTAAKDGATGSLSYASDSRKLAVAYESPLAYLAGSALTSPWTIGASISILLGTGGEDSRKSDSLALSAKAEKIRVETAIAKLSLNTRLAYQAWVRAADASEQADRSAVLAAEILETLRARAGLGEVTATVLARATLDTERAALNAMIKAVEAERMRLSAAQTARYPTK